MDNFIKNFAIVARHSTVYAVRRLAKYNIGYAEVSILMYLAKHQDVNQDSIAKYFVIDKGSVTKTITKLEEKDYINRVVNQNNLREKKVTLTSSGQKIINIMTDILKDSDEYLLRGITKNDIQLLQHISNKILDNSIELINREEKDEK